MTRENTTERSVTVPKRCPMGGATRKGFDVAPCDQG